MTSQAGNKQHFPSTVLCLSWEEKPSLQSTLSMAAELAAESSQELSAEIEKASLGTLLFGSGCRCSQALSEVTFPN